VSGRRRLYERAGCWKCVEVREVLEHLEVDYEAIEVARTPGGRATLLALTGESLVPVLVDDDVVVWDRRRIVRYLEQTYGTSRGTPAEELPGWMGGMRRLGDPVCPA
jgi:glutaredoxin 3